MSTYKVEEKKGLELLGVLGIAILSMASVIGAVLHQSMLWLDFATLFTLTCEGLTLFMDFIMTPPVVGVPSLDLLLQDVIVTFNSPLFVTSFQITSTELLDVV
ncbi:hypothetical protein I0P70_13575 [Pontibacter sp. FD36]|uniref:hypothetical protein n=1 Tax=Pontibacter sp. FD36 TaxID=2789860 RepID=UPI0018A978AD|nr:hypothetical protein [Pontibacter sp. FD36]MBF8964279.1 hypothetical protein [Pontibacter sp. FD36]